MLSEPACDGALPYHADPSAFFEKRFYVTDVALAVPGEFLEPEIGVGRGHSEFFAFERVEDIFFEFSAGASDCGHVFVPLFERKRVGGKFNSGWKKPSVM